MKHPIVSIIIGSHNNFDFLKNQINAIRNDLSSIHYELIVVDTGSNDGSIIWLAAQKDIVLIVKIPPNNFKQDYFDKYWTSCVNAAAKVASGKYVCMLNHDALTIQFAIKNGVQRYSALLASGQKVAALTFFRRNNAHGDYFADTLFELLNVNYGLFLRESLLSHYYFDEDLSFPAACLNYLLSAYMQGYVIDCSLDSLLECAQLPNYSVDRIADCETDLGYLKDKWSGVKVGQKDIRLAYSDSMFNIPLKVNIPTSLTSSPNHFSSPQPKISVVTIVRNDKEGLQRTVESVKSQNYPNFEYIVIDGASTDGTIEVANIYQELIDVFISESDAGIYSAMNKGIDNATGDFIIFMNAGDTFHDGDTISNSFKNFFEFRNADVIYGSHMLISGIKKEIKQCRHISEIFKRMVFNHQSAFFRKSKLVKFKFNETYKYAADYDQIVRLYKANSEFVIVDVVVANFYAGGASQSGLRPYLEALKIQFDNFDRKLIEEESVYFDAFKSSINKLLASK
jgi:glycosyltransferase involved in cell wall biosynthesis